MLGFVDNSHGRSTTRTSGRDAWTSAQCRHVLNKRFRIDPIGAVFDKITYGLSVLRQLRPSCSPPLESMQKERRKTYHSRRKVFDEFLDVFKIVGHDGRMKFDAQLEVKSAHPVDVGQFVLYHFRRLLQ